MTTQELVAFLHAHHIPISQWGLGGTKTVRDLHTEIDSGEAVLEVNGGMMLRSIRSVRLNVFYKLHDDVWKLHEQVQVFWDGQERSRNLEVSLAEKMVPSEDCFASARRALGKSSVL